MSSMRATPMRETQVSYFESRSRDAGIHTRRRSVSYLVPMRGQRGSHVASEEYHVYYWLGMLTLASHTDPGICMRACCSVWV